MLAAPSVLLRGALRACSSSRTQAAALAMSCRAMSTAAAQFSADAASAVSENATAVHKMSIVKHPHALAPGHNVNAASVTNGVFAVISLSGSQYKITQDDVIVADKLHGVDIGQIIEVSNVLMLGSKSATVVGRPEVPGATVRLEVEEMTKDRKVIAFKFRRRKSSRRTRGFRREVTILRVKEIDVGTEVQPDFA